MPCSWVRRRNSHSTAVTLRRSSLTQRLCPSQARRRRQRRHSCAWTLARMTTCSCTSPVRIVCSYLMLLAGSLRTVHSPAVPGRSGHGGVDFYKFRETNVLWAQELAETVDAMWRHGRWGARRREWSCAPIARFRPPLVLTFTHPPSLAPFLPAPDQLWPPLYHSRDVPCRVFPATPQDAQCGCPRNQLD